MRFHDRVTVLGGLDATERGHMVDCLLGVMSGGSEDADVLSYRDDQGRRVAAHEGSDSLSYRFEDGKFAPAPWKLLALDASDLQALAHLQGADLGIAEDDDPGEEPPELQRARATFAELSEKLAAARAAQAEVDTMAKEVALLQYRWRRAEELGARAAYADLVEQVKQVRAEADAIKGGAEAEVADRAIIDVAERAVDRAHEWRRETDRLAAAIEAWGIRERLDHAQLAEAAALPAQLPAVVDTLVATLDAAESRCRNLEARIAALAGPNLPEASDPTVPRLARVDQEPLWSAAREAVAAAARVAEESLALGGVDAEGFDPAVVADIDRAQHELEDAEQGVENSRRRAIVATASAIGLTGASTIIVPAVAPILVIVAIAVGYAMVSLPTRRVQRARQREQDLLERVGASTYLAFHMRRIEATSNPTARAGLDQLASVYRDARATWRAVAGDIEPSRALVLEDEVRAYAARLAELSYTAAEIDTLSHELSESAEPEARAAVAALLEACDAPDTADPRQVVDDVRRQIELAARARGQRELDTLEEHEAAVRDELERLLDELGADADAVEDRVAVAEAALGGARRRQQARTRARSMDEVKADLSRLQARVRREHRPEWDEPVTDEESETLSVEDLARRYEDAFAAHTKAARSVPVERRIGALRAAMPKAQTVATDSATIEHALLARVNAARSGAVADEGIPVILDEAFVQLDRERKLEVLDLLERVSEKRQIVYLTDDPDVMTWARRRANAGGVGLLAAAEATV